MRLRTRSVIQANIILPPTNVTAEVSGSDIVLGCTAAHFVDSYNYYYSIDGGTWTLSGNEVTTSHTFTPTTPGEYNFRVTSVRGGVESDPSAETLFDEMMTQVYSDTISGLRISAVDGTAFVDAAAAITGYADANHLLEIEDSAGKVLSGVLSAQGSGETLGIELVTNGDFSAWTGDNPDGWGVVEDGDASSNVTEHIDGCQIIRSEGGPATAYQNIVGYKKLYYHATSIDSLTGTFVLGISGVGPSQKFTYATAGAKTGYKTALSSGAVQFQLYANYPCNAVVSSTSLKQVLTPSTNGATLVNEIFGSTENVVSVDDGFAYNESSYLIRVKQILPTGA